MGALVSVSAWIAPLATALAALMTAANLGSRVTGWGFIVFAVASVSWAIQAAISSQTSLLGTQIFLTLVNLVGAWRWLGRQAKFDEGGKAAARRSTQEPVPTLFSMASLIGSDVAGKDVQSLGKCVDAMSACDTTRLTYLVLRQGGIGGLGESLHAIDPDLIRFTPDGAHVDLTSAELSGLPVLQADSWPDTLP